jgi:hypothetical protein
LCAASNASSRRCANPRSSGVLLSMGCRSADSGQENHYQ